MQRTIKTQEVIDWINYLLQQYPGMRPMLRNDLLEAKKILLEKEQNNSILPVLKRINAK